MSFSIEVKKELCKQKVEGTTIQSLLCGAILSSGSLVLGSGGVTFTISSENHCYIEFFTGCAFVCHCIPQYSFRKCNPHNLYYVVDT